MSMLSSVTTTVSEWRKPPISGSYRPGSIVNTMPGAIHVGARDAGPDRLEGDPLRRDRVLEQPSHLVGRRADNHRPLELRVVAPDRRARLRHEYVAFPELDVVGDCVRPRAAQPDLAAVAGRRAVGGREPAPVPLTERLQHRERRLMTGPETRFG